MYYDLPYRLLHRKTNKIVQQPSKKDRYPYLNADSNSGAEVSFKLCRVKDMAQELGHPSLKDSLHLQNGDLVLLQNP